MNAFLGKYYETVQKLLCTAAIFLVCYVFIKYLLPFLTPFVIAVIVALINEPLVSALERHAGVPRKVSAAVSLLITVIILGMLLVLCMTKMYYELVRLQGNISAHINDISNFITRYSEKLTLYYNALPETVTHAVDENIKGAAPKLQGLIGTTASYLVNAITSIPRLTVCIATTILSAYFMISDRRIIGAFLYKQVPGSWSRNFAGIKIETLSALIGYFKALLFLMLITFIEVCTGLMLIKADYILLMGLIAALSDAIPILGTGIVFFPWIAWNFLTGNMDMVFSLSIIYLAGVLMRQILEPKIVGSQIGLHPLATLVAMYIGLELFGIVGMFIGPISIIILRSLQESGVVRLWNS